MKTSNEGVYAPCPKCGGRMELYKFYAYEEGEKEIPPVYSCENCAYEEVKVYERVILP